MGFHSDTSAEDKPTSVQSQQDTKIKTNSKISCSLSIKHHTQEKHCIAHLLYGTEGLHNTNSKSIYWACIVSLHLVLFNGWDLNHLNGKTEAKNQRQKKVTRHFSALFHRTGESLEQDFPFSLKSVGWYNCYLSPFQITIIIYNRKVATCKTIQSTVSVVVYIQIVNCENFPHYRELQWIFMLCNTARDNGRKVFIYLPAFWFCFSSMLFISGTTSQNFIGLTHTRTNHLLALQVFKTDFAGLNFIFITCSNTPTQNVQF